MPYTLTYTIDAFSGAVGQVLEAPATSLLLDASQRLPTENPVVQDGTSITVQEPGTGVTLNIRILSNGVRVSTYYPVGLAIQPASGGVRPPATVFPVASVSKTDSTVIVLNDTPVLGVTVSYEFVVLFQAPNGNFGWLDPRVTNDGD
jgi:hypothetical protein